MLYATLPAANQSGLLCSHVTGTSLPQNRRPRAVRRCSEAVCWKIYAYVAAGSILLTGIVSRISGESADAFGESPLSMRASTSRPARVKYPGHSLTKPMALDFLPGRDGSELGGPEQMVFRSKSNAPRAGVECSHTWQGYPLPRRTSECDEAFSIRSRFRPGRAASRTASR